MIAVIVLGSVVYLLIGGACAVLFGMDDTEAGRYIATIAWPAIAFMLAVYYISMAPSELFIWLKKRKQ